MSVAAPASAAPGSASLRPLSQPRHGLSARRPIDPASPIPAATDVAAAQTSEQVHPLLPYDHECRIDRMRCGILIFLISRPCLHMTFDQASRASADFSSEWGTNMMLLIGLRGLELLLRRIFYHVPAAVLF